MRYVYLTLIVLIGALVLLFSVQNLGNVTITFLTASATLPLAALVLLAYGAGMVTGGSVLAVLGSWIRAAGKK